MRLVRIVLVHGAGGTPATWDAVAPLLRERGHPVTAATLPMESLEGDVAHTMAAVDGPVLLVGHSYGGAVITNVGRHPRVRGLVYVAAFAPDEGETVQQIVERYEPAPVSKHMRRGPNGEWRSERTDAYWAEIGWDLTAEQRAALGSENRQADKRIFEQPTGVPAWRTLPSWYLVADQDATLLPQIQRDMAARAGSETETAPGSHFTPLVHPERVVALVEQALAAVGVS
jgi:pimeloyl-ACP methyl ester carboxylesterase